jgi:hypothetical protein
MRPEIRLSAFAFGSASDTAERFSAVLDITFAAAVAGATTHAAVTSLQWFRR